MYLFSCNFNRPRIIYEFFRVAYNDWTKISFFLSFYFLVNERRTVIDPGTKMPHVMDFHDSNF